MPHDLFGTFLWANVFDSLEANEQMCRQLTLEDETAVQIDPITRFYRLASIDNLIDPSKILINIF